MRSLLAIVAAIVAGGSIRHLPTEAAADPAESSEIRGIALDPTKGGIAVTSNLRDALVSHVGDTCDRDTCDKERLAKDRDALVATLAADGYLEATVTDRVTREPAGVFVVFSIDQGPKFHVRALTVRGASDKDAGVVALQEGDIATADRIDMARRVLAERLTSRGSKIEAVVALLREDHDAQAVDIELVAH